MQLWTEYEGRTLDDHYTLHKLLRSEGRNGFFSTADTKGKPAVLRITEVHFDGDEQLARWKQVAAVKQENLIAIERFGRTKLDDVPLTYALMEANDAALDDVLRERPLTQAEALQVARAVAASLAALHAEGLVHEHVDASNVLAVGETVKLRSDCVRECKPDGEFMSAEDCAALRRKDVADFGRLILRCLTLHNEMRRNTLLSEPFHRFIPLSIEGKLSLEQINSILTPTPAPPLVLTPRPAEDAEVAEPVVKAEPRKPAVKAQLPLRFRPRNERRAQAPATDWMSQTKAFLAKQHAMKPYGIYAAAALVAVLMLWHFTGSGSKSSPIASSPVVHAAPEPHTAPVIVAKPAPVVAAAPTPTSGWHVIAYTYNHRDQAQAKADKLAQVHGSLQPQVFSPKGSAPYLVALGGAMTHDDAAKVLRDARRTGMPRDTFIRNY